MSWIWSSPVNTQLSETPLSSMARGSTVGTTSGRDSPHKMVRECSLITARVRGRSGSGDATGGSAGAIHSSMIIAMASAEAAGASHVDRRTRRAGGGASASARAERKRDGRRVTGQRPQGPSHLRIVSGCSRFRLPLRQPFGAPP